MRKGEGLLTPLIIKVLSLLADNPIEGQKARNAYLTHNGAKGRKEIEMKVGLKIKRSFPLMIIIAIFQIQITWAQSIPLDEVAFMIAEGDNTGSLNSVLLTDFNGSGARKITRIDYSVIQKFGEYYRTPSKSTAFELLAGRIVKISTYNNQVLSQIIENTFDPEGRISSSRASNEKGDILWEETYTYNNGRLIKCDKKSQGILQERLAYTYDAAGVLTKRWIYGSDGTVLSAARYERSPDSLIITLFDTTGGVKSRTQLTTNGNQITRVDKSASFSESQRWDYSDKTLSQVSTTKVAGGESTSSEKATDRTVIKRDRVGLPLQTATYSTKTAFGEESTILTAMTEWRIE